MKGFIEINEANSDKVVLINVAQIESVIKFPDSVLINMINNNSIPRTIRESYEEIVNKIKEATEE